MRFLTHFLRLFAFLLALFVAAPLVVICLLQVQSGRTLISGIASSLASSDDQIVKVENLYLSFGLDAEITEVSIADRSGTFLTVEQISLSWHPLHLLVGSIDIEMLSVAQVDVTRLPNTSAAAPTQDAPTEETTAGGFLLPVNINLESLELSEINLGDELLGAPVSVSVAGSGAFAQDPALATAILDVGRIDGIEAGFEAQVEFEPAANKLAFDIKLSEPRGGLAARLLDVPDLPAVDLVLKGDGPLSDWQANLDVSLDGRPTVTGSAHIGEKADNRSVSFDLNGDLAAITPPAAQAFVQGTTHAKGSAILTGEFVPVSGELTLTTGTVSLHSKGALDGNTLSADGTVKISAGDNALIALDIADRRIAFGPFSSDFTVSGSLSSANWRAGLDLASLETSEVRLKDIRLDLSGSGAALTPDSRTSPFLLDLNVGEFSGLTPQTEPLSGGLSVKGSGNVDGLAGTARIDDLAVNSAAVSLVVSNADLSAEQVAGQGRLSLADLSRFSGLAGRELGGKISGSFSADLDPANIAGKAAVTLVSTDLLTGIEQADALLSGDSHFEAQAELDGTESISITGLSVKNTALNVEGNASLKEDTLASNVTISLADLAVLDPQLGGSLSLEGTTSGPLTALKINASATSRQILLSGTPLDDLSFSAEGTADPQAPTAVIKSTASLSKQLIAVDVELASQGGGAQLNPLSVKLAGNSIDGNLTIDDLNAPLLTLSGDLNINAPDLQSLSPLLLTDIKGDLKGTFSADPEHKSLQLNVDGSDIELPAVSIGAIKMKASIAAPYSPERISADIALADILTDATPIHAVKFQAAPSGDRTAITADVKLDQEADDGLTLSANFSTPETGMYKVNLASLAMQYRGIASRLSEPATIAYKDGQTSLEPLNLQLGSGTLTVSGSAGKALDLQANLASVPLTLANAFVPSLGLGGSLSGTLGAKGDPANPDATWQISGSGLTANELKNNGLAALNLSSSGTLKNELVSLNTSISDPDGLKMTATGTVGTKQPNPLNIALDGAVPIAAIRRPLLDAGLRGEGAIAIKGSVSGSALAPAYQLTASPSSLKLTSLSTGLTLQNISGTAAVSQDQASINNIQGELATGGTLRASGTVGMKDGFPADFTIDLDDGRYVDPGLVTAVVGAQVKITGPLASQSGSALISGTIGIEKADISIPESLPGAVSPVDVRHIHASQAIRRQIAELGGEPKTSNAQQKSVPPRLDILLSAPGRIFVRGRGLDTELQGSLKVVGTTADPQAIGAFSLKRGQLDILTRRLVFSRGSATFEGSLTPIIDFAATTTVDSTAITVTVSGEADDPQIVFTSSPELPQDEVLALLLFGKSVGNLSATQVARLAAAIATLTGGSDNGPLASIRKSLGLDAIDINTDGENGPSLAVGKYINDNIYLGVEQGTGSNSSRVKVDIDLDRGLKVRGEVGADGSSKAGIFFEREY